MKLLIIEDNRLLATSLKQYLSTLFTVRVAHTAAGGTRRAIDETYDLIMLDLQLPDGGGLEVCRAIRSAHIAAPILVLTADHETTTKLQLFEAGADDFLTKPFQVLELRARLLALARRIPLPLSSVLVHRDLTVDPVARVVERDGQAIKLSRKEFNILEYLVRQQGRVVTRAMIFDHVWEESGVYDLNNTVTVHVKYLRDKIDRPFSESLIETVHGVGYIIKCN